MISALEFARIKKDLLSATEVSQYVYEVYQNSEGELCISLLEGHAEVIEDYIFNKFGEITVHTAEQTDYRQAELLAGPEFVPKAAIGPGSCIVTVDSQILQSELNNLEDASGLEDVIGCLRRAGSEQSSWGTLGCLALVSDREGTDKKLYSLTAKHVIESTGPKPDTGNDANIITGIDVKTTRHLFHENDPQESYTLEYKKVFHISDGYSGTIRDTSDTCVDVALLGPIYGTILASHANFDCSNEVAITTRSYNDNVKKIGATTGLTRGKVIGVMERVGILVVRSRFCQETQTGQRQEDTEFAKSGDSGSLLLLDDASGACTGVGIVFRKMSHYTCLQDSKRPKTYDNVILCANLSNRAQTISHFMGFDNFCDHIKLYLSHLHPRLHVHLA